MINTLQKQCSLILSLLALAVPCSAAGEALDGLCAKVKIEIAQELTLERIGFEATLEVTNNDGEDPLTEFSARLFFMDPSKDPEDPDYDATSRFYVQPPTMETLNRIDGAGVIGPTKTAVVRWFIIPKIEAGGTDPRGKPYLVSCELGANIRGAPVPEDALLVMPESITVKPDAQLDIVYFQPQYVTGDDPFTPEVESAVPFTLGVLVRNKGYGPANKLQIASQQPRIVENLQGLLLVARLLGARVMDAPLDEASLTVELGNLAPGQTAKGAWDMLTSLSGIFTEFKASYRHAPELGGEETSVITSIAAHFIIGEVLNDEPGRDTVRDFLADTDRDDWPDTLFETDGQELPVNVLEQVTTGGLSAGTLQIDADADYEGWVYFRLDDPGQGRLALQRVTRSDGKVLNPHNAWLDVRYTPGRAEREYFLHVLDRVEIGQYQYTAQYVPPAEDTAPPVTRLRFDGPVSEVDGAYYVTTQTRLYFTADDASPVSIVYKLDDGAYRPALPFNLREPSVYQLSYYAEDAAGNAEAAQTVTVHLGETGPQLTQVELLSGEIYIKGSSLSVRSDAVTVRNDIADGPLDVDARVSIYRGLRAFPTVRGVPPSPTGLRDSVLSVGGAHVDYYKYRLNGGAWSAERAVGTPLELVDFGEGAVRVEILGRPAQGAYPPDAEALVVEWTIADSAPQWQLTDAPSQPSRETGLALTVSRPAADAYRWNVDDSYDRAEAAMTQPIVLDNLAAGAHSLALIGRVAGEWETAAAVYRWRIDPNYGSDYSGLPLVVQRDYAAVQGTQLRFDWDGRDADGKLSAPGWYTVVTELSDSIGRRHFDTQQVQISEIAGQQATLVAAAQNPRNPNARGRWVVWQQRGGELAWQVHALDLGTPGAEPIALTSGGISHENPATDGRYAVWQQRQADGSWDIAMLELSAPSVVSAVTTSAAADEINPVIDWPWIVYQTRPVEDPAQPWQLVAYNLETSQRQAVYPGQDAQIEAAVDAGRVVWRDMRDPGNGEIYLQALETGETLRLTEDLAGQFRPQIRGHWVAWQDNRDGQVEIVGQHLLNGRNVQLSAGPGNKARPFIEGDWLVYEEDSFAFETANIGLLNLSTGASIPLTYDSANKRQPTLVAGQVVWQEGEGEPYTVRSASLPTLQAAFRSGNMLLVTAALAARYGDAYGLLTAWNAEVGVTHVRRYTQLATALTEETATWEAGAPSGDNFGLAAGAFIWVEFPQERLVDLGERLTGSVDLQAGLNVFSYGQFPLNYTAHRLCADLGSEHVVAVRMLDAANGLWRSVEVGAQGTLRGADFEIPPVAVLLLELAQPVSDWMPQTF